jgi:hypothetical protein
MLSPSKGAGRRLDDCFSYNILGKMINSVRDLYHKRGV